MTRKETTKFLTDLLIADRLSDRKYYAKEVTIDANTTKAKRVDVMQFVPVGVFHMDGGRNYILMGKEEVDEFMRCLFGR